MHAAWWACLCLAWQATAKQQASETTTTEEFVALADSSSGSRTFSMKHDGLVIETTVHMEESLLEASTSYDASDTAPNRLRERFPIPVRRRQYNMTHSVRGSCYKSDHTIYSTVAAHGQVVLKTNKQGDKYYPDVETNPGPGMFGMRVVEEEPGGNAVRVAFIMQLKSSTPGWSSCCTTYYTWIGWFSWRIMAVSFNEIAMYQYCFPHHLADANRDKCDAVVIVTLGNPPGVTKCNIALSEETCDQCDENTAW